MSDPYLYEERAAIKQYLANLPREQSEKEAREEYNQTITNKK